MKKLNQLFILIALISLFLIQITLCQDDDNEDEDDDGDSSPSVREKIDPRQKYKINLNKKRTSTNASHDFYMMEIAAQKYQALDDNGTFITTPPPIIVNTTASNSSTTNLTSTTTPEPLRTTSELTRVQEVEKGVNGILSNVAVLNIPGIVSQALSIRTPDEDEDLEDVDAVNGFVNGILSSVFCAPVLNLFSTCRPTLPGGEETENQQKLPLKNQEKPAAISAQTPTKEKSDAANIPPSPPTPPTPPPKFYKN